MPRLTRMRLVCVGHPNARFDDVTLNFQDHQGRATDSTLWLRNGGGKSSLLNLFFAVVRPDKREFLGGKAEAKRRKLEDYVQDADRAVVICEWEADAERDSLGLPGAGERLLTGVFYEWRSGGAADLRRLYFGCRIAPEHAELTLDGLPLYRMEQGKKKARRHMSAFKQHWSELRDAQPHLSIFSTEQQVEWAEWLSAARIDPDLFSYQVRMNHREGGADDLFRFDEPEQFVNFLLDLVLDPKHAEAVRKNIETFRYELKERSQKLVPMRELLAGLISKLEPIEALCDRRDALNAKAASAAGRLISIDLALTRKIKTSSDEEARCAAAVDRFAREHREASDQARVLEKRVAWLERHLAQQHVVNAEADFQESQARMQDSIRSFKLWQAAVPLRDALRFEHNAREYVEDLERRNKQHAPLARDLEQAATQFVAALSWQLEGVRKEEQEAKAQELELRKTGASHRGEAAEARAQAARADAEAKSFEGRLKEARKALDHLRKQRVVADNESAEQAAARLPRELAETDRALVASLGRQTQLKAERVRLEIEKETLAGDVARSKQKLENGEAIVADAAKRKAELEANDLLRRRLQVDAIDLEAAGEGVLDTLRRQQRDDTEKLITLRIEASSSERAIAALEQTGLLPPSADAEKVLRAIKKRINTVWSGWAYLSENTPEDAAARRSVIERHPHAVMGVVVSDKDFKEACLVAKGEKLSLDSPVAIVKQSDFNSAGETKALVIGPESAAYHAKGAGQEELIRRRHDAESAGTRIEDLTQSRTAAEDLLRALETFFERCPKGWFRQQKAEIQKLAGIHGRAQESLLAAGSAIKKVDAELQTLASGHDALQQQKLEAEKKLLLINQYSVQYGAKLIGWEEGLAEARQKATRLVQKSEQRDVDAAKSESAAVEAVSRWARLGLDAASLAERIQRVKPRIKGDLPKPRKGNVAELESSFQHLESVYEKEVDAAGLRKAAQENEENALRCRKKLRDVIGELKESDVNKTLDRLADPELAERSLEEANDAQVSARGTHGNAKKRLDDLKQKLKDAEAPCVELAVTDRDRCRDEGELASILTGEQAAANYRVELNRLKAASEEAQRQAVESQSQAERFGHQAQLAKKDAETLAQTRARFDGLLNGTPPPQADEVDVALDVEKGLKELETVLRELQGESSKIDSERRACVGKVRNWASDSRFQNLKSALVQRFLGIDEVAIEEGARKIKPELALHLQITEQQIAEKDKHRDLLIQEMWGATEEGLSLLARAERQSRLPESLPGLGGAQFLHISLSTPADPAARRDRLGELVDEWINSGEVPSAMGLIQQAVHRLARPIRVKVLNPDPDLKSQSVDITEMTRFSGGERLTCAILLYCTLAQLRARHRGMSRSPSSVLLLDNPIGRASRPKFLELQRAVAKEMGVQLIYTTGVDDYGALHALPNIIRLKNSRVNLGTGQRHVELENGTGAIEAAQISRKEPLA